MLWRVAEKIEPVLKIAYQKVFQPPAPNIRGDRDVEYSWMGAKMPAGPGEALDFGCGPGWSGFLAARKGFNVTAIDLGEVSWFYEHPRLKFIKGDLFNLKFTPEIFKLVINCSAIEHVGLSGRYGVVEQRQEGDIEAMGILRDVMSRDGIMLLTIPVGADRVFSPLHRVYGQGRLPKLLEKYDVLSREFWVKDGFNKWVEVDESSALLKEPVAHCYGLGLFVLRPH